MPNYEFPDKNIDRVVLQGQLVAAGLPRPAKIAQLSRRIVNDKLERVPRFILVQYENALSASAESILAAVLAAHIPPTQSPSYLLSQAWANATAAQKLEMLGKRTGLIP